MTKIQPLFEGATVWVQGYEFTVRNLRIVNGVARFTGVCTNNPRNDSIRHTSYNGGTYGGNHLIYSWEA